MFVWAVKRCVQGLLGFVCLDKCLIQTGKDCEGSRRYDRGSPSGW